MADPGAPMIGGETTADLYRRLMRQAAGLPNEDLFARMLASQAAGTGVLPPALGLSAGTFATLATRHFPGAGLIIGEPFPPSDEAPLPEFGDLVGLLLDHRAGLDVSERWMAEILATGCRGHDHLWQDLGLWSRPDLSRLLTENFPRLAEKNRHDMKWKKFLYRQLCEREGVPMCPTPSCRDCVDYPNCFSPET